MDELNYTSVADAAKGLAGRIVRTPTLKSDTLSAICGAEIWLKFENLQFTSSFKDRGACWRLLQLTELERAAGVIAVSAGNHAQGVANHAARLGIPATIVMPLFTPNVKVHATEALGAEVILHGSNLAEAFVEGERLRVERNLVFVPPFDDPWIIAGQGTCGIELFEDCPTLDYVVVPVGGGGLLAGFALVAPTLSPMTRLVGVQMVGYPSMLRALTNEEAPVPGGSTIAEGIAVAKAGALTAQIVAGACERQSRFESSNDGADIVTVTEEQVEDAVNLLLEIEKTVAEGAGATGLAAILCQPERYEGKRVGTIVTGGNIDPRILASIIMRGLVRSGRMCRLTIEIADLPGSLAKVATIISDLGGNIVEVAHQRLFTDVSAKNTALEVAIETRDRDHIGRLISALHAGGYPVVREFRSHASDTSG